MTDPAQDHPQAAAAAAITVTDYQGFDRRKEYREWRSNVDQRLDDGADTMRGLRKDIAAYNAYLTGAPWGYRGWAYRAIDAVAELFGDRNHCRDAWEWQKDLYK